MFQNDLINQNIRIKKLLYPFKMLKERKKRFKNSFFIFIVINMWFTVTQWPNFVYMNMICDFYYLEIAECVVYFSETINIITIIQRSSFCYRIQILNSITSFQIKHRALINCYWVETHKLWRLIKMDGNRFSIH